MVTPQWGTFQTPKDVNPSTPSDYSKPKLKESEANPQWGNFLNPNTYQGKVEKEQEGWIDYLARNLTANTSRVLEQLGGFYGNIESLGRGLLSKYPATGGLIGWGISELVGPEKWKQYVGEGQILPTSEDFKKTSEEITKGYTKPKTTGEAAFQEFTEDATAALRGFAGRGLSRGKMAFNTLVTPAAANVTKQTLKGLGFSEDQANMAKLATWLPLTLAGNVNASNYASDLMRQGRQGVPSSVQANVPRLTRRLAQVEQRLLGSDPRSELARQQIARIRDDLANGRTNSQAVFDMYDAVNAAKRNRGLFDLSRTDRNFARRSIDEVRNVIRDEIRDIAAPYPEAYTSWRNGVQAWATIHQSQAMTNWIESMAKGPYAKILTGPAAALFGLGGYGASKIPAFITTKAAIGAPAAYKGLQTVYRMWNNAQLRNYYWNAVEAASQENFPAFIKNYEKLNKEMKSIDEIAAKNNKKNKKN